MVQTIYGILAILLTMLLSLNLFRVTTSTERRIILNEVATPFTRISVDILEHVGNKYFDENTDESDIEPEDFPLVTFPAMLTPATGFGNSGDGASCDHATPDFYDPDCNDIDDFDGMVITHDLEGIVYTATISVRYVDEDDPNTVMPTGTNSYAKEVTVTITSNDFLLGDNPFSVQLSRVFTYNRVTS